MIDLRQVSLTYPGGIVALRDVTLKVDKGEFAFVVGQTATGKSSLLKLINREIRPTEGSVFVDGQDIGTIPASELWRLRRKVGVVFQDFKLLPDRTVWQNVAFALRVTGASTRSIRKLVPQFLELVGLMHRCDAVPSKLSGGEQQRAAIARAIAIDPAVLLADEPTGNLDPATSWEIMQLLERINLRGATVLVSTHDSEMVNRMRKRVIALHAGTVVRDEDKASYHAQSVNY